MLLRDDQWERIAPLVRGKAGDRGRCGANTRLFVEAVLAHGWTFRRSSAHGTASMSALPAGPTSKYG